MCSFASIFCCDIVAILLTISVWWTTGFIQTHDSYIYILLITQSPLQLKKSLSLLSLHLSLPFFLDSLLDYWWCGFGMLKGVANQRSLQVQKCSPQSHLVRCTRLLKLTPREMMWEYNSWWWGSCDPRESTIRSSVWYGIPAKRDRVRSQPSIWYCTLNMHVYVIIVIDCYWVMLAKAIGIHWYNNTVTVLW